MKILKYVTFLKEFFYDDRHHGSRSVRHPGKPQLLACFANKIKCADFSRKLHIFYGFSVKSINIQKLINVIIKL